MPPPRWGFFVARKVAELNIPESITRCAVEGDLLKVVLDSRDSGSVPNARQLRDLKATVTATVPYLSPPEGMFVMPPFVFETNQVGQIINPESPDDAPLIPATNQVHTPEFRYLVEVTSPDLVEPLRWRAAAPAGGVLNLSEVVDPPAPEDIPAWEQTLAEVEAARAEVVAAAPAAVQAAADAKTYRDQAGAIAAGDIIDDVTPSPVTVFSSQKLTSDLGPTGTDFKARFLDDLSSPGGLPVPSPVTGEAVLTAGASGGVISLERTYTSVVAQVTGLVKAGSVEHVATIPVGFRPPHSQGHGWLADSSGAWWPVVATTTQILVLGPPPAGTVLNGSLKWKAA